MKNHHGPLAHLAAFALAFSACATTYDDNLVSQRTRELYTAPHPTADSRGRAPDAELDETVLDGGDVASFVAYGLASSAELRAAFERWSAATERVEIVSTLPDPQLSYTEFLEEVQTRTGPQERRLGISQAFPWPGELDARARVARHEAEAAWQRVMAERLRVTAEIEVVFHEYAFLGREKRITEELLALLRGLEPIVQSRVRAGGGQQDLLRLQVEIGRLEDDFASIERRRPAVSARLADAIHLRGERSVLPLPDLRVPELERVDVPLTIRAALESNPELRALAHELDAKREAEDLVAFRRKPRFRLGVDYFQTGDAVDETVSGSGDDPLAVGLTISLPIRGSSYSAAEREARHTMRAQNERIDAALSRLRADVEELAYRVDDAARRIELYGDSLIPRASEALELTSAAYRTGNTTVLDLIDSERALLEFQLAPLARLRRALEEPCEVARVDRRTDPMNRWKPLVLAVAGAALVLVGCWSEEGEPDRTTGQDPSEPQAPSEWTCPMHAQIRLPEMGNCPLCGMELTQVEAGGVEGPRQLVMSESSKELARIATAPVERRSVARAVRLVGKVDYDETAIRTISAWVPGRLERLFVDYTGVPVEEGDHLVRLYSPDLVTAQEELIAARERLDTTGGEASEFLAASNERAYASARDKLLLWGLTPGQVDEIERRDGPENFVTLNSPSSGVIIEKLLDEGAYVETGSPIYRIADLGQLWVRLDAYEQDLPWLRYGQPITVEVEALPGTSFEGRIATIDPFIDEHTRTAKVRVNLDNTSGRLKPGMFVRAVAFSQVGPEGEVLDSYLAGKWISPMHPEIVKDGPGTCDICGMDLVAAEDLGLAVAGGNTTSEPLVVPASAVLVTGKRAIAYVEVPDVERPTFEGREVVLGPRAGDEYVVLSGLEEGERVVVNGAFRIDSSMQIRAKPSMMSMPAENAGLVGPEAERFREALQPVYAAYLTLQESPGGGRARGRARFGRSAPSRRRKCRGRRGARGHGRALGVRARATWNRRSPGRPRPPTSRRCGSNSRRSRAPCFISARPSGFAARRSCSGCTAPWPSAIAEPTGCSPATR